MSDYQIRIQSFRSVLNNRFILLLTSTLFRGRSCEKVAPAGQFEAGGRLVHRRIQ